jgi:cytochrome c5
MKTQILLTLFASAAAAALVAGCHSNAPDRTAADPAGRLSAPKQLSVETSGSELWGETCTRCHNLRPPDYYSDAQWETIVHHMRLRANLTGQEARKITAFLKSAN